MSIPGIADVAADGSFIELTVESINSALLGTEIPITPGISCSESNINTLSSNSISTSTLSVSSSFTSPSISLENASFNLTLSPLSITESYTFTFPTTIGNTGQVLTSNGPSSPLSWSNVLTFDIQSITSSNTTTSLTNSITSIIVTGTNNQTLELPSSPTTGLTFNIESTTTGIVTINYASTTLTTINTGAYILVRYTGSSWEYRYLPASNIQWSNSNLNISNSINSTSPTTGSITTLGGIGVSQDLWVGGAINANNIVANNLLVASNQLVAGATSLSSLSVIANTPYGTIAGIYCPPLAVGNTVQLLLGQDTSQNNGFYLTYSPYAYNSPLNSFSIDNQGTFLFSILANGQVLIPTNIASTSYTTGSLTISGGLGLAGAAYFNSTLHVAGITSITNTTASTSYTTGALVVSGGLGIAGSSYFNNTVSITGSTTSYTAPIFTITNNATNPEAIANFLAPNMASNKDISIDIGYAASTSNSFNIGFSFSSSGSASNYGYMSLFGNALIFQLYATYISITASTASTSYTTGALVITGGLGLGGAGNFNSTLNVAGITSITNTTASISYTSGALQVSGGVGIAGSVYINTSLNVASTTALDSTLNVSGITSLTNTTNATSYTTGALIVSGGLGLALAAYLNSTLNVAGITSITNTTASTSNTTGALTISGGVGISGALNVGGATSISSGIAQVYNASSPYFAVGLNSGVSTNYIQVAVASGPNLYANGTQSGDAVIRSSNNLFLGSIGSLGSNTVQLELNTSGDAIFGGTDQSTSYNTGAVQVPNGGIGCGGTISCGGNGGFTTPTNQGTFIGFNRSSTSGTTTFANQIGSGTTGGFEFIQYNNSNVLGNTYLTMSASSVKIPLTTAATSYTTGALVVSGGLGIAGSSYFNNTVSITASTSSYTTATFMVTNNATNPEAIANFYAPNVTSGNNSAIALGYASTAYNSIDIGFYFSAAASTSNYGYLALAFQPESLQFFSSYINIPLSTASTSNTTGALTISGGVGISGALNVGGATSISSGIAQVYNASSPYFAVGLNSGVSTNYIQVAVASGPNLYANGTQSGDAVIRSSNNLFLGSIGSLGSNTVQLELNTSGDAIFGGTDQSTSYNTGAVQVPNGGIGCGGTISCGGNGGFTTPTNQGTFIGWNRNSPSGTTTFANQIGGGTTGGFEFIQYNNSNVLGNSYLTMSGSSVQIPLTTNSSSSTTGALTVSGGMGIADNVYIGGNLYVQNNLVPYQTKSTFTPTINYSGTLVGLTYNAQGGTLIKMGNFYFISLELAFTYTSSGSSWDYLSIAVPQVSGTQNNVYVPIAAQSNRGSFGSVSYEQPNYCFTTITTGAIGVYNSSFAQIGQASTGYTTETLTFWINISGPF